MEGQRNREGENVEIFARFVKFRHFALRNKTSNLSHNRVLLSVSDVHARGWFSTTRANEAALRTRQKAGFLYDFPPLESHSSISSYIIYPI